MLSRICEELNCTPLEAIVQPLQLTLRIIELRQFARVKQAVAQAKTDDQVPKGPLADLCFEFEHELLKARKIRIT